MAEQAKLATDEIAAVEKLVSATKKIKQELARVIVGQDRVIDQMLISIFSRGHCILEGVPGLAKTLLVSTLARSLSLSFSRIQFTPDLMPTDITGTDVIVEDKGSGNREFKFIKGPLFANVVLADEINRTPPKTQAALLEAMQEHQVTAGGKRHELPSPFFVLATQNPIEQEGTYPLPEAQQDRFMFKITVSYPTRAEELRIIEQTGQTYRTGITPVLGGPEILAIQDVVHKVPAAEHVATFAMDLVRKTRVHTDEAPAFIKEWVSWGAGPRACQYLVLAAKARAILDGRYHASTGDVKAMAHPVLRHRIVTNYNADSEGITADKIVDKLIETTPAGAENERVASTLKA